MRSPEEKPSSSRHPRGEVSAPSAFPLRVALTALAILLGIVLLIAGWTKLEVAWYKLRLRSDDESVRGAATLSLLSLGDAGIDALADALRDSHHDVRLSAALTLGWTGSERAVPPLVDALRDGEPGVRLAAVRSLSQLGFLEAIPGLIDALADNEPDVRTEALCALRGITGKDHGENPDAWRAWLKASVKRERGADEP